MLDPYTLPAISISAAATAGEDSDFAGQFLLNIPTDVPIDITYHTIDDTATSPDNYQSQTETIEIQPGETAASFFISTGELTEEQRAAGGATFHVQIDSITGAPLSGSSSEDITIVDTLNFIDRFVTVNLDWSRLHDVILDSNPNSNLCTAPTGSDGCYADQRYVEVTLTGPDGLSMSEIKSMLVTGGPPGGGVTFPLLDPNTQYTVSITTSGFDLVPHPDEETGEPMAPAGLTLNFNSSTATSDSQRLYTVEYDVLSQQNPVCNSGPNYTAPFAPESCLKNWQPPAVEAFDIEGANDQPYVVLSGGTLNVRWDAGVLCGDLDDKPLEGTLDCGKRNYDPDHPETATQALTAQLASQPPSGQGSVDLNNDGSFVFHAAPGFYGQTFFQIKASAGRFQSLPATVHVGVPPQCSCFQQTLGDPFEVAAPVAETDLQMLERRYPAATQAPGTRAIVVSKIESELVLTLLRNDGDPPTFSKNAQPGPQISIDDALDQVWKWIQSLGQDITKIQNYLNGVKTLTDLTIRPQIYQVLGEIRVRPIGGLFEVVKKGGGFLGGPPTQCWQYVKPYKPTTSALLIAHDKQFLPITIDVRNTSTWEELLRQIKAFYIEFATKIRRDKPNAQAAATAVPVLETKAPKTPPIVVFKQKPL